MYTQTDLAYLAGLLDGEGCFVIKLNNHEHFSQSVTIGMTDTRTVKWVQATFGGLIFYTASKSSKNENVSTWALCKRLEVEKLISEVKPYLKTKLLQALIMEEFCKTFPKNKTYTILKKAEMAKYAEYMRTANARGLGTAVVKERFLCTLLGQEYKEPVTKTLVDADELLCEIE